MTKKLQNRLQNKEEKLVKNSKLVHNFFLLFFLLSFVHLQYKTLDEFIIAKNLNFYFAF